MLLDLFKNPELQRNAWIELRPNRVLALFGILAFAFIFSASVFPNEYLQLHEVMINLALPIFYLLVAVWGSKNAADAVADEINQKTWDRQRMTGQRPWTLTFGKIFGPTLLQWLGGVSAMGIYFCAALFTENVQETMAQGFVHICIGLLANVLALLFSLLSITGNAQSSFSHSKINTNFFFILTLIIIGYFGAYVFSMFRIFQWNTLSWYGMKWGYLLTSCSLLTFIVWSIIGVHQNLRTELQYKNNMGMWLAFLGFIVLFFLGFVVNEFRYEYADGESYQRVFRAPSYNQITSSYIRLISVSLVFFCITQFLLVFERKSLTDYRHFLQLLRNRKLKALWVEAPLWLSSALFMSVLVGIMLVMKGMGFDEETKRIDAPLSYFGANPYNLAAFLFLLLRDIYMTRFLLYKSTFKNTLMVFVVYYALLYWVIPFSFEINHRSELFALFWPTQEHAMTSAQSLGIQALAAWLLHRSVFGPKEK
ncbi:MAG: hypothetical protein RLZZ301_1338 [Bacteroidota bacterium]|jgi:hypothetical protein